MNFGERIFDGPASDVRQNKAVLEAYLGGETGDSNAA
jgi:ABC-type branched-subunit amino acid transport system ATPase component